MATHKILVRVMNDPKNKRTFKKFTIKEFPEMDVQCTTRMLVEMYGEHLGFSEVERAEIGYIGYSNQKFKIKTNDDLQRAFESGALHKNEIAVFYICRKQEESTSKRTAQDITHGKYNSIAAFCRYFKFFISFCNINFFERFPYKMQPQRKCPQTTAILIRTVPRKTRDHESSRRENHSWKKQSKGCVLFTMKSGASVNTGCGQLHW